MRESLVAVVGKASHVVPRPPGESESMNLSSSGALESSY